MAVKFDTSGFDKLRRNLQKLDGKHAVSLNELMNPTFMRRNTQFSSVDDMVAKSGFEVNSIEDFKAIPDAEWDQFIRQHTRFGSWREMQEVAVQAWTKNKLGL
jgi:hypothetical protein